MSVCQAPPQTTDVCTGVCTVVIVSYYTGPMLLDCLRAALEQDAVDAVVLVDNGNDVHMRDRVDEIAAANTRLRVLRGFGNVGFARGCNLGVAVASTDYLLLLNPDCVMRTGVVMRSLDVLTQHPQAAAVTVKIENPDGSEQRGARRNLVSPKACFVEQFRLDRLLPNHPLAQRINLHETGPVDQVVPVACISGAFMMMQRDAYLALGGMDEDYFLHFEDVDFCLRMHKAGHQLLYIPDISVMHRKGTSRALPLIVEWHKSVSAIKYFNKHFRPDYSGLTLKLISAAVMVRFVVLVIPLTITWLWNRGTGGEQADI